MAKRLARAGVPVDATAWTVDDWRELHRAVEMFTARIAALHKGGDGPPELVCPHCSGSGRRTLSRAYRATWEKVKTRAAEFTAAGLAREWGVPATRVNNQLAALERHGLLSSTPDGRGRLYRVRGN